MGFYRVLPARRGGHRSTFKLVLKPVIYSRSHHNLAIVPFHGRHFDLPKQGKAQVELMMAAFHLAELLPGLW